MVENLGSLQCRDFLQENPAAVIIDVRTTMEYSFVGHPPEAILIVWKEFPGMKLNAQFVAQVEEAVPDKTNPILLLCRSGARSLAAAKVLEEVGYQHLINIADGFEGDLDEKKHRGNVNGWRFHGLPWIQS
ncbi:MAG: rhodanese-like domain-containing protein [Methylococcales symbiont of Hymedesmia sp. n. MRB-2018]|nr:MAG: rhodanese-like domain-containing protein [Methylococcales symbiont of Hymedesmia sp. n. MRB-2018]KAF3984585.1 MAG: rhodanese-like domain-containing protein [Methylococcales symbiont of Hymedesmia sp. n. MRB-2018]